MADQDSSGGTNQAHVGHAAANPAEAEAFLEKLRQFYSSKNEPFPEVPVVCSARPHLYDMWVEVANMGGSQQVCCRRAWATVGRHVLGLPDNTQISALSYRAKRCFIVCLLPYEREVSPKVAMHPAWETSKHAGVPAECLAAAAEESSSRIEFSPAQKRERERDRGVIREPDRDQKLAAVPSIPMGPPRLPKTQRIELPFVSNTPSLQPQPKAQPQPLFLPIAPSSELGPAYIRAPSPAAAAVSLSGISSGVSTLPPPAPTMAVEAAEVDEGWGSKKTQEVALQLMTLLCSLPANTSIAGQGSGAEPLRLPQPPTASAAATPGGAPTARKLGGVASSVEEVLMDILYAPPPPPSLRILAPHSAAKILQTPLHGPAPAPSLSNQGLGLFWRGSVDGQGRVMMAVSNGCSEGKAGGTVLGAGAAQVAPATPTSAPPQLFYPAAPSVLTPVSAPAVFSAAPGPAGAGASPGTVWRPSANAQADEAARPNVVGHAVPSAPITAPAAHAQLPPILPVIQAQPVPQVQVQAQAQVLPQSQPQALTQPQPQAQPAHEMLSQGQAEMQAQASCEPEPPAQAILSQHSEFLQLHPSSAPAAASPRTSPPGPLATPQAVGESEGTNGAQGQQQHLLPQQQQHQILQQHQQQQQLHQSIQSMQQQHLLQQHLQQQQQQQMPVMYIRDAQGALQAVTMVKDGNGQHHVMSHAAPRISVGDAAHPHSAPLQTVRVVRMVSNGHPQQPPQPLPTASQPHILYPQHSLGNNPQPP